MPEKDEGLLLTDKERANDRAASDIIHGRHIPEEIKNLIVPIVKRLRSEAWQVAGAVELAYLRGKQDNPDIKEAVKAERERIGIFLEESKETFYAVYRDSTGEQTYTIARHALDKMIKTLKAGQALKGE